MSEIVVREVEVDLAKAPVSPLLVLSQLDASLQNFCVALCHRVFVLFQPVECSRGAAR